MYYIRLLINIGLLKNYSTSSIGSLLSRPVTLITLGLVTNTSIGDEPSRVVADVFLHPLK